MGLKWTKMIGCVWLLGLCQTPKHLRLGATHGIVAWQSLYTARGNILYDCLVIHSTIAIAYSVTAASLQLPFAMHRITAMSFRGLREHRGCFCNSLDCCHRFWVLQKHRSCTRNFSDLCSRSHGLQNDRNHTCDLQDLCNCFRDSWHHCGCFSQV